jgi:ubiquinone/menaquinone biosynthesis C-methylase UbiE
MFDEVAIQYDETFTHTQIGSVLRRFVWDYLDFVLPDNKSLTILELNCGTGEDAIYLAGKGHQVVATDISSEMVRVVENKIVGLETGKKIHTLQCDMKDISQHFDPRSFDLVFSNFGGLNCLSRDELVGLSSDLANLLKRNGRFIGIVMSNFCLWESLYFTAKLKFKEVFRRITNKSLMVKVGSEEVETWYYAPGSFNKLFSSQFEQIAIDPIGFFLPPSYLEPFFQSRKKWLDRLIKMESKVNRIPLLAFMADHFLIDLKKRIIT